MKLGTLFETLEFIKQFNLITFDTKPFYLSLCNQKFTDAITLKYFLGNKNYDGITIRTNNIISEINLLVFNKNILFCLN